MGSHDIGFSTIYRLVTDRRQSAAFANDENVSLKGAGRGSVNLETAVGFASKLVDNLIKKGSWVDDQLSKIKKLKNFSELSEEEILERFKSGIALAAKLEYVVAKHAEGIKDPAFTEKALKQMVVAYTADFVSSMLHSHRAGITAKNALDMAVNTYRNAPNSFAVLSEKFPDIDRTTIIKALTSHEAGPEKFLAGLRERIEKYSTLYPEFVPSYVKHVVVGCSDDVCRSKFEEARVMLQRFKLDNRFKHLPDQLLQNAIFMHPGDTENFLSDPSRFPKGYKSFGGKK